MIFHVKAPFRIELFQAGHAKTLVRIYVDKKMFGVFRYFYFMLVPRLLCLIILQKETVLLLNHLRLQVQQPKY